MMKKCLINGVMVLALGLTAVSCSKETDFTNADALKHAESVLGVTIDPTQDWKMTQEVTANVTVNLSTGEKYEVMVFDKNPFENSDAVYYVKKTVSDATVSSFDISVPSALTELYVSVFDSNKHSYSQRIAINGEYVNAVFGAPMENSYAAGYSFTRANSGITYPQTSGDDNAGINANANEWADPNKKFGGWLVPDTLTPGQKERVKAYFQANPNLTYKDPEWRHFFVQQVYKGGTAVGENSPETVTGAGGTEYNSDKMNKLTVGESNFHLNNFNAGTYGVGSKDGAPNVSVLDNGGNANDGPFHSDQIMLMVNVDDTSCFGYHQSGVDVQRNDKAALVSASVIDDWAKQQSPVPGEDVVDKWNRSFMGFDNALKYWDDIIIQNSYAMLSNIPGNLPDYVLDVDGETIMTRGSAPDDEPTAGEDRDITDKFANTGLWSAWNGDTMTQNNGVWEFTANSAYNGFGIYFNESWEGYSKFVIEFAEAVPAGAKIYFKSNNQDQNGEIAEGDDYYEFDFNGTTYTNVTEIGMQVYGAGTFKISKMYLVADGDAPVNETVYYDSDYILVDDNQIPFISSNTNQYEGEYLSLSEDEMKITVDGKVCVNLPKFKELYDAGYRPYSTTLKDWVKPKTDSDGNIVYGDGYFSDWIVTLCEAQRIVVTEEHDGDTESTPAIYSYAFEDSWYADYDMNDVVVKVQQNANDENKIDITLCCTGAAYNLYVYLGNEALFGGREVHAVLGGTAGKFINTGNDSSNDKFQTKDPVTTTVDKPANGTLGTLDIWIKSPEKNIHVAGEDEDPHGVVIPHDWQWPTEWTSIKTAYPDFIEFAKDKTKNLNWYDSPSNASGVIYGK